MPIEGTIHEHTDDAGMYEPTDVKDWRERETVKAKEIRDRIQEALSAALNDK